MWMLLVGEEMVMIVHFQVQFGTHIAFWVYIHLRCAGYIEKGLEGVIVKVKSHIYTKC